MAPITVLRRHTTLQILLGWYRHIWKTKLNFRMYGVFGGSFPQPLCPQIHADPCRREEPLAGAVPQYLQYGKEEIFLWSEVSGVRKMGPSHFAGSVSLMSAPHSSGCVAVACSPVTAVLQPGLQGPN